MHWIVALLYITGGALATAAAIIVVYRISFMKVWEAGVVVETEWRSSTLQYVRDLAAADPTNRKLARQARFLEGDDSFFRSMIEERRSLLLRSLSPEEIKELFVDAVEAGKDPVWALMRREFTLPVVLGLVGVSSSTVASVWSLWL